MISNSKAMKSAFCFKLQAPAGGELDKADHPAHGLYEAVKDKVAGVSCGCADVFGARVEAEKSGYDLLTENAVPGTSGLPSLRRLTSEGYSILTF
jgi:hypothetical protein